MIAAWSNGVYYESDVSGRANLCILKQASQLPYKKKKNGQKRESNLVEYDEISMYELIKYYALQFRQNFGFVCWDFACFVYNLY